jgi:hypothetical protein
VADARDIVHQIEYRWHERRDLSPVASTMSQESLRVWDSLIRAWVRHPHTDGLRESVCYQILPNGRAALAWRYEDWQAAECEDGTRGRPLVSRVLAGQASLLPPEVAITLCRTGPSAAVGPQPGQVTADTRLSVIKADELSALVRERAAELDEEAARQEGLRQLVVAALSHPNTPLAIHIRDTDILKPPDEGMQCPLLWGLRRIIWPLLATTGRGWSFSTFELPLGEVDPAAMPDILFRQAQAAPSAAPARLRDEIKIRPFDSKALDAGGRYAELAEWLVAEYQERGGDELEQFLTEWCGAEQTLKARLFSAYDELCARHSPAPMSGPSVPSVPVSPAQDPGHEPDLQPVPPGPDEPAPVADDEPAPAGPDEPAPAGPPEPAPAEGRLPEHETVILPRVWAPGQDQAGPVPKVLDQQAEAPQVGVGEVAAHELSQPDRDPAQPSEQNQPAWWNRFQEAEGPPPDSVSTDTDPYPAVSGHAGAAEYEDEPQGLRNAEYHDDLEHGGNFPYQDTSARPPQPDTSFQSSAWHMEIPEHSSPTWSHRRDNSLSQFPKEGKAPPLAPRSQSPQRPMGSYQQFQNPPRQLVAVSNLLKKLPTAPDAREFESILQDVFGPGAQSDPGDRVKARREVSKHGWYDKIHEQFGDVLHVDTLSNIFQIIIIPDLDNPDVVKKITEWTGHAHPAVIGGLLVAAKQSGDDTWQSMMQILQPRLAYRWTIDHNLQALWDPNQSPPGGDSGRGRFSFFKRN